MVIVEVPLAQDNAAVANSRGFPCLHRQPHHVCWAVNVHRGIPEAEREKRCDLIDLEAACDIVEP